MNRSSLILLASAALLPVAAGCDGASSARETSRTEAGASRAALSTTAASVASVDEKTAPVAPSQADAVAPAPDSAGYLEATFDDVKFEMTKTELFDRSMLTPKVNALFGKPIRIRGYMYPTLRRRGLTQFVLVRDNMECCFGPGAALYDCILVSMAPGKTAEYSIRPVAVEGIFRLEELPGGPGGRPLAIYQMTGDRVE